MVNIDDCERLTLVLANGSQAIEIEGYYLEDSIDTTPPEGYERYAIRHSDDDMSEFATLENYVMVNRAGFFYSKEHLDFPEFPENYYEIIDWSFDDD